jgi:large subunit ribosomal protein L4
MILEQLKLTEPKTKEMAQILATLGVDSSALIVTDKPEESVVKSAHNLAGIRTLPANLLNVLDILSQKRLLMTVAAVRKAEQLWGKKSQGESSAPLRGITPPASN